MWLLGPSLVVGALVTHASRPLAASPALTRGTRICSIIKPVVEREDPEKPDVPAAVMPARWLKVHDCERPARWRELHDAEDCRIWRRFGGEEGLLDYKAKRRAKPKKPRYTDLVPSLTTMDDFMAASERALEREKLLIVKFYSARCRACKRIATYYRRLALDNADALDCYECEVSEDARPLYERLEVTEVPSVHIFDPMQVTRLAKYSCSPKDFKKIVAKVDVAMLSMKKRRGLHRLFGEQLLDDWVLETGSPAFFIPNPIDSDLDTNLHE